MNKITKLAVAAALVGASASASAWWDSPQGFYPQPQAPFATPGLTESQQAAISAQQQAFADYQTQRIEQALEAQRKGAEPFAARQSEMARQWQERMAFDPLRSDPFASIEPPSMERASLESPFGPPLPEQVKQAMEESNAYAQKRMEESNARFEKARQEMTAAREAHIKAMETRRAEHCSRSTPLTHQAPEKTLM
jgi:hypothetical protein